MGLDVCHYKLTLHPEDKSNYLEIDGWTERTCNLPLEVFASYIQDIPSVDFSTNILVIEDERYLGKIEKDTLQSALKVYTGQPFLKIRDEINSFIRSEGLGKLERLDITCGSSDTNDPPNNYEYLSICFGQKTTVQGMYYNEVGYQRKGMNKDFYMEFGKHEFYGKKEDFEKALMCVGDDRYIEYWGEKAVNRMREDFRKEFVDTFEFGVSLLHPSF